RCARCACTSCATATRRGNPASSPSCSRADGARSCARPAGARRARGAVGSPGTYIGARAVGWAACARALRVPRLPRRSNGDMTYLSGAGARANRVIVGVLKETKTDEYRVALLPVGAQLLVSDGHRVLVEAGAGAH